MDDIEVILNAMRAIKTEQESKPVNPLIEPDAQMAVTKSHIGNNSLHYQDVGPALLDLRAAGGTSDLNNSLFAKHYASPSTAQSDHDQSLNNAKLGLSSEGLQHESTCFVLPPLFIRYQDPANAGDAYIPFIIVGSGELHETKETPDLIVNFHKQSQAITLTVCRDPGSDRMSLFERVIQWLYSLISTSGKPVTVKQFLSMYDQKRYETLQSRSLFKPNTPMI